MIPKPSNPGHTQATSVSAPAATPQEPSVDPIQLVRKNWLLLGIAVGVGLGLGLFAYKIMGPKYTATSRIVVKLKNPIELRGEQDRPALGERSAHVEIIKSPKVIERAVRDSELDRLPTLAGSDDPTQDIIDGLKIDRTAGNDLDQLNVLKLQYLTSEAEDAKKILNAVVKAYDEYLRDDARANHAEMQMLLKQIDNDLAPRLAEKTKEYQEFRQNAPMLWSNPPGSNSNANGVTNIHHERVETIAAERVKVELLYQELTSRLKVIRDAISRGESREALLLLVKTFLQKDQQSNNQTVVAGGSERQNLDSQLMPLLLEEQMLLKRYNSEHPDVRNVRKRIELVKEYYQQMGIDLPTKSNSANPSDPTQPDLGNNPVTTYVTAMQQQQAELKNRLDELQRLYESSREQAKTFAQYELKDQKLSEELERIKSLHNIVTNRVEALSLAPDSGYQMQQLSPSQAEPDLKHAIKIVGGCMIACLGLTYGFLFLRELQDNSMKSLNDLRNMFESPLLGTLPSIHPISTNDPSVKESGLQPMLYYYHEPGSREAEACRSVRATFFVKAEHSESRVVQITSSEPGDGKTTTTSNLAISMAQAGKRVLIVDADLRRPMIHKLFGLREGIGLSECLRGEIEWINAVQSTRIENLSILTSGSLPAKPAELLSSYRLRELFGAARNEYDYVLIDSPPVLAVSDSCIIARKADAALLVVRMYKNSRPCLKRTLELFDSHGIYLAGIIANGLEEDYGSYENPESYQRGYQDTTPPSPKPTSQSPLLKT